MKVHLYLLCNQTDALVASHLEPEAFGNYMAVGTRKNNYGHVMFLTVDPSVQESNPAAAAAIRDCVPHSDGTPRKSKYASIYRALEGIPLSALGNLHLSTRDGRVLSLAPATYAGDTGKGPYLYQELSPVGPMIASNYGPAKFAQSITNEAVRVYLPRVLFADMQCEREADGRLAGYLPYGNPGHIVDCLNEVAAKPNKGAKTVNRNPDLNGFYRSVGQGFFLGDSTGLKFYPYPSKDEMDDRHHIWYHSACM